MSPSSTVSCVNDSTYSAILVLTSCTLARLQLIQIPPANGQISLVLIHTSLETSHLVPAHTGPTLLLRVLSLSVRQLSLLRLLRRSGFLNWSGSTATAAEESSDCVTDRGTDCDTTAVQEDKGQR